MLYQYSSFWFDIYNQSIVEHDHRLRLIDTKPQLLDFDEIVDADLLAVKNDVRYASLPIVIYLNKLAPKSQRLKRLNKYVIYQRKHPAKLWFDTDNGSLIWDDKMTIQRWYRILCMQ